MTAEIAIINRHAIALAADSAVTVGKDKVWKTANKLFSLGPCHDIAIMVYGSGDFLGLAWEAIVKEFRRRMTKAEFRTVESCATEFKNFLGTGDIFSRDDQQKISVLFPIFDILGQIKRKIGQTITAEALLKEISEIRHVLQSDERSIPAIDEAAFKADFSKDFDNFCEGYFSRDIANKILGEVEGLALDFFLTKRPSEYHSGVVIAGFGSDEYHPALSHHIVDGRWGNNLRWWDGGKGKDLNTKDHHDEFPIIPFAQDDMSYQFMTGISPEYLVFLRKSLSGVMQGAFDTFADEFVPNQKKSAAKVRGNELAEKLVSTVMDALYEKVREDQYKPINRAVTALPKEEMALMAESLVDLTSLKRKVDSKLESVGGPADVAVISKGDGFVWIKRKHYFDGTKNSDFFARKKMRDGGSV